MSLWRPAGNSGQGGCSQWRVWRSGRNFSHNTRSWTGQRSAPDTAIAEFARQTHAGPFLETPRDSRDSRIRTIGIDGVWRGVVLAPDSGDTYCLLTVLPQEKVNDFAASHRFGATGVPGARGPGRGGLRLILAHPFAAWRAFLHPSQHEIAYRVSYSGSAHVTAGPAPARR